MPGEGHGLLSTLRSVPIAAALFWGITLTRKGFLMLQEQAQGSETTEQQAGKPVRNPYILNFCRVLIDKKGESHQPESLEKLLGEHVLPL